MAPAYAARRPRYPDALFAFLATLPVRRRLAWDCGAGSGQAALPLAGYFTRVIATDTSADQLRAAPSHPRVEYRVAPAGASGLETGTVDIVTAAQALHWFDAEAFYAEVERVLAPGGVVSVWTYTPATLDDERVDAALHGFYRTIVGPYWPPERRHVEEGYRDLLFPFAEVPSPAFEMQAQWTLLDLLGYLGTWSAVVGFKAAEGRDPVEELRRELEPVWGVPDRVRRVRWPVILRAGRHPS